MLHKDLKDGDIIIILGYNEIDNWPREKIEKVVPRDSIIEVIKENCSMSSVFVDNFLLRGLSLDTQQTEKSSCIIRVE